MSTIEVTERATLTWTLVLGCVTWVSLSIYVSTQESDHACDMYLRGWLRVVLSSMSTMEVNKSKCVVDLRVCDLSFTLNLCQHSRLGSLVTCVWGGDLCSFCNLCQQWRWKSKCDMNLRVCDLSFIFNLCQHSWLGSLVTCVWEGDLGLFCNLRQHPGQLCHEWTMSVAGLLVLLALTSCHCT